MTDNYLGAADIAALFGVDVRTISQWRKRYPDFPAPDVTIGRAAKSSKVPGWNPSRIDELKTWHGSRPGQGARTDLKEE